MRGNLVTQRAWGALSGFGQAFAQQAQLVQQQIDLLLLAVELIVQLFQQVVAVGGLDLQIDQAALDGLGNVHARIGHDFRAQPRPAKPVDVRQAMDGALPDPG